MLLSKESFLSAFVNNYHPLSSSEESSTTGDGTATSHSDEELHQEEMHSWPKILHRNLIIFAVVFIALNILATVITAYVVVNTISCGVNAITPGTRRLLIHDFFPNGLVHHNASLRPKLTDSVQQTLQF